MHLTAYKYTAVGGAFLSSYSLLLLRWGSLNPDMGSEVLGRLVSVLFWVCLLAGGAGEILFCRGAAARARQDGSERGKRYAGARRGLLTFGAVPEALACDIAWGLALLGELAAATGLLQADPFWEYLFMGTILFGFHMHCFLNGKNYLYLRADGKGAAKREEHIS